MEKRLVLFFVLTFAVMASHQLLMRWLNGPPQVAQGEKPAAGQGEAKLPGEGEAADANVAPADAPPGDPAADGAAPADQTPKAETADENVAEGAEASDAGDAEKAGSGATADGEPAKPEPALERVTIGSGDPNSGFRMLVTAINAGAALERIELNSPNYRDLEEVAGYMGHLAEEDDAKTPGAVVRLVGAGTPAAEAGIQPGDVITGLGITAIGNGGDFRRAMRLTRPEQKIDVELLRGSETKVVSVTLAHKPLEVIRPEGLDPASMLCTLSTIDTEKLAADKPELAGVNLRTARWEVLERTPDTVAFRHTVAGRGIEVIKRFRVAGGAPPNSEGPLKTFAPGYHLTCEFELRNTDDKPHRAAFALDGPNGLPTEGSWYASKKSRTMSATGLRDVAVAFIQNGRVVPSLVPCPTIARQERPEVWDNTQELKYLGVDAQYFSAVLIPDPTAEAPIEIAQSMPILVGPVPTNVQLTNTSCRIISGTHALAAGAAPWKQTYTLFAGPKEPKVLAEYGLSDLVYYGWFDWVAKPMLGVLHTFYRLVGNYGIAIVMLTILVRSCMFPISRRMAMNAQKMQELQPELKKLQEKYKNNMEGRAKAQQQLFKEHGYNPMSGCLPMFIQFPIFIGLYSSLQVDVSLRQAPLLGDSIRWCSNLAAPDMLFRWDNFMPGLVTNFLGPYFNIFPVITIALFLVQQKMFMPPATDEQTRMQQNMMQYMMVFMGIMFFKVPSGLCIYFIASSLWGLAERKLLPKKKAPTPDAGPSAGARIVAAVKEATGSNGTPPTPRRKQRGRS